MKHLVKITDSVIGSIIEAIEFPPEPRKSILIAEGYEIVELAEDVAVGMFVKLVNGMYISDKDKILETKKTSKTTQINQNNPASNPLTLEVDLLDGTVKSITFTGGDSSASAISGAVTLAQNLGELHVKIWDNSNIMYGFSFDESMVISASLAKVWRDTMYERNSKLQAIENATTIEELELIKWT